MGRRNSGSLTADVLVIGGGPAGAWAAWSAARQGAKVVLADKGYLGSSGATAPGGTNLLVLPPDAELREQAVRRRTEDGGYLSEPRWIHRVLDQVYESLQLVESWGYPFRRDEQGVPQRDHLHGPEYMRLMRRKVQQAGVTVLDQSPALELLADEYGVGGARGVNRLDGTDWEVQANAVVLATGGCAFLAGGLGCNVLTGDGYLMASELGAELSGMEFTRQYAPSPAFGSNTRGRLLNWATYTNEQGEVLQAGGPRPHDFLPRMLSKGAVYAVLDKADTPEKQAILRTSHTIFFMPLDRAGIDPFTQRFPLTLRYEGTVRGTGGIRLVGDDCATTIAGLYAAGDAATRERVTGGRSGGGAYNASWAISSGTWSGAGAARYALAQPRLVSQRSLKPAGRAGLPPAPATTPGPTASAASALANSAAAAPSSTASAASAPANSAAEAAAASEPGGHRTDANSLIAAIQREVFPLDINYFRSESSLQQSLSRLHALWPEVYRLTATEDTVQQRVRAREAAAMAATARWMYTAALARKETRGMHTLAEYPELDPAQQHRLLVYGLDSISVRPEPVPAPTPDAFHGLASGSIPARTPDVALGLTSGSVPARTPDAALGLASGSVPARTPDVALGLTPGSVSSRAPDASLGLASGSVPAQAPDAARGSAPVPDSAPARGSTPASAAPAPYKKEVSAR